MRRVVLFMVVVSVVVVALPGTAQAKGKVESMAVCGQDGCANLPVPRDLRRPGGIDAVFMDAAVADVEAAPGPYFELRIRMQDGVETLFVLPQSGFFALEQGWLRIPDSLLGAIRRASAGVQPFPFALTSVVLGTKRAEDASAYAGLLSLPRGVVLASDAYPHSARWVTIDFGTARMTPWTQGPLRGYYDPVLQAASIGGSRWSPVPDSLAKTIERDAGITRSTDASGSTNWSGWALGTAVLIAVASAIGVLLMRLRHPSRPAQPAKG
jgi:hypothetical protein